MTAMLSRARSWNAVMTATPGECDISIPSASVRGNDSTRATRQSTSAERSRLDEDRRSSGASVRWSRSGALPDVHAGGWCRTAVAIRANTSVRRRTRGGQAGAPWPWHQSDASRCGGTCSRRLHATSPTPRSCRGRADCCVVGKADVHTAWTRNRWTRSAKKTSRDSLPDGAFLAHMRLDSGANRLVGCSIKMGMPSRFTFREYDRDGHEVASCEATVPGMHFVHDFVVTPRWYVLPGNALKVDALAFVAASMGRKTLIDAIAPDAFATGCVVSDSTQSTRSGADDRVAATRVRRAFRQRLRRRFRNMRRRFVRVRIVRVRPRIRLPGCAATTRPGVTGYARAATSVQSNDQRPFGRGRVAAVVRLRSRLSARASIARRSRGAGDLCVDAQRPYEERSVRFDCTRRCAGCRAARPTSGRPPSISSSANRCSHHDPMRPMPTMVG